MLALYLALGAVFVLAENISAEAAASGSSGRTVKTSYSALEGWAEDDHRAALQSFLRFCKTPKAGFSNGPFRLSKSRVTALCQSATAVSTVDGQAARQFFETEFEPHLIEAKGFVTGYYEPELSASRVKTAEFSAPLLKAPDGLVRITSSNRPKNWPDNLSHGRKTSRGIVPLPDRGAIMDGALANEALDLVYLADPVEAFFVHVQGSARLKLVDGSVMRVGYAGKTGYPYSSVARILVQRGEGTPEQLTMEGLRRWFAKNPERRDELLAQNRSFIFFREVDIENPADGPIGAAGLPLVAGRSLAVDLDQITLGLPVFVQADLDDLVDLKQHGTGKLVIADDTGSAIKGAARGDLFIGSGLEAGKLAGEIRHPARMTVLVPKPLKARTK
ncbi:murein transglycosylase A [Roseibium algae]|uniref:peptidoglycan lytic exotransglycosylase n=1 Tax=Roseibium algae TaxID=3123038 RepID=A0ABU8TLH6_9HYPH